MRHTADRESAIARSLLAQHEATINSQVYGMDVQCHAAMQAYRHYASTTQTGPGMRTDQN